uniref:Restriction endonuclease PD-(D/E)XK n=1 Tax=Clandestinovirus TaxID=2831644 RepID=A0A8F8KRF9_9VIRU|nr:restriction endonuclease PD-(D/E)XK [Clandestinovirus]
MNRRESSTRPMPSNINQDELKECLFITFRFIHNLIDEGIPFVSVLNTEAKVTRAGKVLMALGNVVSSKDWHEVKRCNITTKSIIHWINHVFGDNISPGGYDSIRRDILRPLLLIGLVEQPNDLARNNPTRGFYLSDEAISYLTKIHQQSTDRTIKNVAKEVAEKFKQLTPSGLGTRFDYSFENSMNVHVGEGHEICLESGGHNLLQKAAIEMFLPIYDPDYRVLYLGDAKDRYILYDVRTLSVLGVGDLTKSQKLPDVLVWCPKREKLLLIEAVHSSGAVTDIRVEELKPLLKNVEVEVEYLTVFKDRSMFKKFASSMAWDSMVWLMDEPKGIIRYQTIITASEDTANIECLMDCE